MMTIHKTIVFTCNSVQGEVIFEYDHDGLMVGMDLSQASLNAEQKHYILTKMPRHYNQLKLFVSKIKGGKLEERKFLKKDVTFDQFWDKYNHKSVSSRKVSQKVWDKLSQKQRDKAFNFIYKYEKSLPPGIAKKYAETYLRQELWNN